MSVTKLKVEYHYKHCCDNGMLQFSKLNLVSRLLSCTSSSSAEDGPVNGAQGKQRTFIPTKEKPLALM